MLKRFLAVSDNHGSMVHRPDAEAMFSFIKEWKPHYRLHLGDNWDFANLRRGADPKEEGDDMEPDITAGFLFLERLRPTHFLLGNHDHRGYKAVQDHRGLVRQFAKDLTGQIESNCKRMGTELFPYHRKKGVFQLGNLKFLHGYHASTQALRQHVLVYGNCAFGHIHTVSSLKSTRDDGAEARCIGCMADYDLMTYAEQRTATNAWERSWLYGVVNEKTGETASWQARKVGNKWMVPTGFGSL